MAFNLLVEGGDALARPGGQRYWGEWGQYGVEGAVALMGNVDDYLDDPGRRDAVLEALRIVESDPALLGVSSHLLTVAVTPVSRC